MKLSKNICNVIFSITTMFSLQSFADVAVIVNPANSVKTLSVNETKAIFLGKTSKFPDGSKAVVIDQTDSSTTRSAFSDTVLGKTESQLKAYWSKRIFSGKGTPPKTVSDDAAVKKFVASTPGAIGYVDSGNVDSSVTVVSPLE